MNKQELKNHALKDLENCKAEDENITYNTTEQIGMKMTECKREELIDKLWELVERQKSEIEIRTQWLIGMEHDRDQPEHEDEVYLKNCRMALYGEMQQLDSFSIELRNLLKYME